MMPHFLTLVALSYALSLLNKNTMMLYFFQFYSHFTGFFGVVKLGELVTPDMLWNHAKPVDTVPQS